MFAVTLLENLSLSFFYRLASVSSESLLDKPNSTGKRKDEQEFLDEEKDLL